MSLRIVVDVEDDVALREYVCHELGAEPSRLDSIDAAASGAPVQRVAGAMDTHAALMHVSRWWLSSLIEHPPPGIAPVGLSGGAGVAPLSD